MHMELMDGDNQSGPEEQQRPDDDVAGRLR